MAVTFISNRHFFEIMSAISTLDDYIDDILGSDSTSYTDAKKHRSMTRWAHNIVEEVMEAMADSDFQGEYSLHDLVANQREYLFPSDLLKIKKIDLKLDGSNWKTTNWIDETDIRSRSIASEADIIKIFNNNNPFVSFFDESYFIWSGTIIEVTDGIKIWYNKEIVGKDTDGDDITSFSADTDSPYLKEFAQMALVFGAVLDFALKNRMTDLVGEMNFKLYGNRVGRPSNPTRIGGLIGQIRQYYTNRIPDRDYKFGSSYREEDFGNNFIN